MACVVGHILLSCGLLMNMLDVEILSGNKAGKGTFLSIIKLKTNDSPRLPFVLSRKHFCVRLAFTINKSQGLTISNVEIYLRQHVFSHGQLYVALSSGVSQN
jgi:ATP-dependent DNA helicase PIF1